MKPLKGDIKKAERFEEIVGILFKQELGYILDQLDIADHLPVHKRLRAKRHDKPGPERLRETFEELGTVFIKFGQIISERPDIIPEEYCEELEKLQDSVEPFNTEKAKEIVDEEIGLDNLKEFEQEPMAAASIAQVHRGELESGEEVVMKVRRPDIKKEVARDLEILLYLAGKADKVSDFGEGFIYGEVEEFAEWTREELDFKNELHNLKAFRENMGDEENIRVPEVYEEYSTEKVLTMEYVNAVKCDNVEEIREMDIDEEEIAKTGIRSVIKQILRDGLLHADPHPSNFMVDREGNLVFLDFGMMTRITKEAQRELGMLMLQIADEDAEGVVETVKRLSTVKSDADIEKFKSEVESELLKLRNTTIQDQSISTVLIKLSTKAAQNGIYLPTKITLIGKGILTMEGIGLKIYPEFQLQNEFRDQVEKLLLEQNSPDNMAKDFVFNLIQNQEVITKLPEKINKNFSSEPSRETKQEPGEDSERTSLLPLMLIGSSTLLIAGSVISQRLLYIGLAELGLGLYLYGSGN